MHRLSSAGEIPMKRGKSSRPRDATGPWPPLQHALPPILLFYHRCSSCPLARSFSRIPAQPLMRRHRRKRHANQVLEEEVGPSKQRLELLLEEDVEDGEDQEHSAQCDDGRDLDGAVVPLDPDDLRLYFLDAIGRLFVEPLAVAGMNKHLPPAS